MVDQCQSKCGRRWEQLWKGNCMLPPCWFVSLGVNEPAPVLLACAAGKCGVLSLLVAPGEKGRKRNGSSMYCQPDWYSKSPASPSQEDSPAVSSLFGRNKARGKWNTWVKRKDPSYCSLVHRVSALCLCSTLHYTLFQDSLLSWTREDGRSWRQESSSHMAISLLCCISPSIFQRNLKCRSAHPSQPPLHKVSSCWSHLVAQGLRGEKVASSRDIETKSLHLHCVSCQQACQTTAGCADPCWSLSTCNVNCGLTEQPSWLS